MNNLNSIVDYLKVFNNINKRPAQEPRNMADGGRIGLRLAGSAIDKANIRTDLKEIIVSSGKVEGQENLHFKDIKNRKTGKVKRVYNIKIIKDTKLGEGPQKGPRKNYTGRYKILTSDPKYRGIDSLEDAIKLRDDFRIKNPKDLPPPADPTQKSIWKKEKKAAIKSKGGYYSGPHTGTPQTHLGHTGNVWGTEKITGDRLAYTPKDINEAMAAEKVGLDHKIRSVSEKMEKIKKQKIPAAMKKKLLEEADTTLIRLASQSQGFKKVTLSTGSTFGGDRLTIDPFDEFAGKTEREINEFVKKWKNKKTWNTAEEFNNIKKAKLFEVNRKSSLKAASKIGKKEQKKIISEVKKNLLRLGGCGLYAGGRVGFKNGSACITKGLAKLKSGNLTSAEKKIVDAMGDGLKASGMPKKFWTTALKGEGYFALADFANSLTKGQSLDKSFSNAIKTATFGGIDLGGNERDLIKYAKERGLDTEAIEEWMDYAQTYGKYAKAHEDKQYAHETLVSDEISGPDDIDLQQSVLDQSPDRIKKLEDQLEEKQKAESIQSGKGYKTLNEVIEGVTAKEWNKFAGTPLDIGFRKMVGMKGDEGILWGLVGSGFREGMEKSGFGEHDALKKFKPQTVMNYHPAYGYKEDIKDVIREGDSPMEDMLEFMKKNYPSSGLRDEALRTKIENLKEKEQWVDTGFGRKKRKVKKDMGTYDFNPDLLATGGIASLMKKKW